METPLCEVDELACQICDMHWDEFHTVLEPVALGDDKQYQLSLVGKIISSRSIVANVVHSSLKATWCNILEFLVEEMGNNMYLFHFIKEKDRASFLELLP